MRGLPRLMNSPYMTGSLGIMVFLLTYKYWSVSTENINLVNKVLEMQQQLEVGSEHIQSLEKENKEVTKQVIKYKDMNIEETKLRKETEERCNVVIKQNNDCKQTIAELKSKNKKKDRKELQEEGIDNSRDELEKLKSKLSSAQTNLSSCHSELNSERAKKLRISGGAGVVPSRNSVNLGVGQLPDVKQDAVSVIRKETQGMVFHKDKSGHWLPILPRGDPSKPRRQPSVSVMDLGHKKRVKKHVLLATDLISDSNAVDLHDDVVKQTEFASSEFEVGDLMESNYSKEAVTQTNEGGIRTLLKSSESGVKHVDTGEVADENIDTGEFNEEIEDVEDQYLQINKTVGLNQHNFQTEKTTDKTNGTGKTVEFVKL